MAADIKYIFNFVGTENKALIYLKCANRGGFIL